MPYNAKHIIPPKPVKLNCQNCSTKNISLFNELSNEELEILNKNQYCLQYKRGGEICKKGAYPTSLICLSKGKVKITRSSNNGTQQIVGLRKPGDFLGFRALMGEKSYVASVIALEEASVCFIDKKDFFKVIEMNKDLSYKIMRYLAQQLLENDSRLVNLTTKHVRARLADTLLMINEFFGAYPDNGYLTIKLKREELAAMANMTTSNAIRILSSFKEENILEVHLRDIKIKDLKKLQKISDFNK